MKYLLLFAIQFCFSIVPNNYLFNSNDEQRNQYEDLLDNSIIDIEYLATYLPENSDANNSNIIKTISLESNEWDGPLINSIPNDTIAGYSQPFIVDLTYNKDTRLG